jgi:hypothetical protein
MSRFIVFLLSIGNLIPALRRLRARGLGRHGETLISSTIPTLFRRSYLTRPGLRPPLWLQTERRSSSRAPFRRASSRSAVRVRFAIKSTHHHLQLLNEISRFQALGPPFRSRLASLLLPASPANTDRQPSTREAHHLAMDQTAFRRRPQAGG